MKQFQKTTVLLLAIVMVVLFLPNFSVSAADSDMRYGRKILGGLPNSAALLYVYDKLVEGCAAETPAEISLTHPVHKISITEFNDFVFPMFYRDYPEYFWLKNGGYKYSHNKQNIIASFTPGYFPFSNLSNAKNQYNAKLQALTANLTGSDYDKAKTLHDRLIQTVTYALSGNDQNSYGALVEGKAVCNGYARAYQHLMQAAGITAWYVRGSSTNPTTGNLEDHAWNIVKLDGQWYYTDVTWDDQGNRTFYAYFNITTGQLLSDHVIETEFASFLPQANSTAANYFVKEDRLFTSYNREKLVQLLKKDGKISQISVSGDSAAFLSALNADLLNVGMALGSTGGFHISYNVAILGKAIILSVSLIDANHVHKAQTTVAQVDSTCLSNGTKAHYICDCGYKFWDQACTQKISDDNELTIDVLSHTPSDWQNDSLGHWKQCTICGSETADTRNSHTDENNDNKCDTCAYALPVADKNGNVTVDDNAASDTTGERGNQPGDESTSPNAPKDPDSPTAPNDVLQVFDDEVFKPVIIGVLLGCGFLAVGITATILLQKKKATSEETTDTDM